MKTYWILMQLWAGVYGVNIGDDPYAIGEGKVVSFFTVEQDCKDSVKALMKGLEEKNGKMFICISYTTKGEK